MLREPSANRKPRLRIEVFAQTRFARIEPALHLPNLTKAILGFAKAAGDKQGVTRIRTTAEDGAAAAAFSDHRHINKDQVAASGVAARDRAVQFLRAGAQTAQEFFKPLSREGSGQRQAQKEAARYGSHGGEVAGGSGESLPADGMRWMAVEEKVSAF